MNNPNKVILCKGYCADLVGQRTRHNGLFYIRDVEYALND